MTTEISHCESPRMASRYRFLRGKSISPSCPPDLSRDSDKQQDSPSRKSRPGSANTHHKGAPDLPPLPSAHTTKAADTRRLLSLKSGADSETAEETGTESAPVQNKSPDESRDCRQQTKEEVISESMPATSGLCLKNETHNHTAQHKRHDLSRLQNLLVTPPPKSRSPLLSLFTRSKKLLTPTLVHPDTPSSVATTVFTSRGHSLETVSNPDSAKSSDPIEKPMSSVSVSPASRPPLKFERRVAVRCLSSTINLPVSYDTNAADILQLASNMMRHTIDPAKSVVVESYLMLGLERRLRRYERILDVMNSWDKDHENSLLILSCPASLDDHDLDINAVHSLNDKPPAGFTLQLYQSSRPGKWNKRWITLLENGSIFATKTAGALAGDLSSTHLCHLTDFDIYTPKQAEMRQSVKPPKKFCYAIKSQRKSVLFPEERNFVHFFSTDDEKTATQFYELVHAWRSWHLVTRKTTLDRKLNARAPQLTFDSNSAPNSSTSASADESKPESVSSGDASSFRVGAFQPLFDIDNISKLAEEALKKQPALQSQSGVESANPGEQEHVHSNGPPASSSSSSTAAPDSSSNGGEQLVRSGSDTAKSDKSSSSSGRGKAAEMDSQSAHSSSLARPADWACSTPKKKPEPKSWFPSAADHTAKLRKETVPASPVVIRRPPMAAGPAMWSSQRRGNNQPPPPLLSIDTQLLEHPPNNLGMPHSRSSGSGGAPIYRPPGTPMTPSAPKARPMMNRPGNSHGHGNPAGHAGLRQRSRTTNTITQSSSRRFMAEDMPPVPPLPSMTSRRDMSAPVPFAMPSPPSFPMQPQSQPQPRHSPPHRSPLQSSQSRQMQMAK